MTLLDFFRTVVPQNTTETVQNLWLSHSFLAMPRHRPSKHPTVWAMRSFVPLAKMRVLVGCTHEKVMLAKWVKHGETPMLFMFFWWLHVVCALL